MSMRFDLVDLQLFIAVAETRSITNGALKVHLALASASERIKGLEDEQLSRRVCSTRGRSRCRLRRRRKLLSSSPLIRSLAEASARCTLSAPLVMLRVSATA